mgnify:CR=1 FL=1
MQAPSDKAQLKQFLGMISYLSKFLPNISKLTDSLRQLEKKDCEWNWSERREKDFQTIKSLIIKSPVLKYFE